jgi:hypothetical protein
MVEIRRQIETEEAKATLKTGEAHGRVMALINSDMDTWITFILTYSAYLLGHYVTNLRRELI